MTLQATTFVDIDDQIQSITYTLNNNTIDLITFENNAITFATIASFNLNQSDATLYSTYLNYFLNTLISNFYFIQNSRNIALPLSSFEIQLTSSGVEHLYYIQTSNGNGVYNTNYVPIAGAASFAARTQITITLQEFLFAVNMKNIFSQQVSLST